MPRCEVVKNAKQWQHQADHEMLHTKNGQGELRDAGGERNGTERNGTELGETVLQGAVRHG